MKPWKSQVQSSYVEEFSWRHLLENKWKKKEELSSRVINSILTWERERERQQPSVKRKCAKLLMITIVVFNSWETAKRMKLKRKKMRKRKPKEDKQQKNKCTRVKASVLDCRVVIRSLGDKHWLLEVETTKREKNKWKGFKSSKPNKQNIPPSYLRLQK
jgi:hypothetical protein